MKQHLNTLYVMTQGAYLARDGETVAVRVEGDTRLRVPMHQLAGIVTFGNVGASPFLLGLCAEHDVGVTFLTENGRFLARAGAGASGNVLLRREQYRRADDRSASLALAQAMVAAKVANCRHVVLRSLRDRPPPAEEDPRTAATATLATLVGEVPRATDLDALRGLEGLAARAYFGAFDALITQQKDGFSFQGRNRRPPRDAVNALLSFLYALVRNDVTAALESVGLDPAVGFLHRDRPGRPGLALDLMEEFRPVLADRVALSVINRQQVKASGFVTDEGGAVTMDDETRKAVLTAYQLRKQEELMHPFLEEKVTLGLAPHLAARLLARHLRGDLDGYPPFFAR